MAWTKLRLVLFWIRFARAKRQERLEREISPRSPLDFDPCNKRAKVDEKHFRFLHGSDNSVSISISSHYNRHMNSYSEEGSGASF